MPYRYHAPPQGPPGGNREAVEADERSRLRSSVYAQPQQPEAVRRPAPRSTSQPAGRRWHSSVADQPRQSADWWSKPADTRLRERLEDRWGLRHREPERQQQPAATSYGGRSTLWRHTGSQPAAHQPQQQAASWRREDKAGYDQLRHSHHASTPRAGSSRADWSTRPAVPPAAAKSWRDDDWTKQWRQRAELPADQQRPAAEQHQPRDIIYSRPPGLAPDAHQQREQQQQQPPPPQQQQQQQQQRKEWRAEPEPLQEPQPLAPPGGPFLPQQPAWKRSLPTLVLDLDETLVHSSFDPSPADLVIPITIDGDNHTVYVRKRPHLEYFLRKCCDLFEVVVWTASLAVYADPLIDQLVSLSGQNGGVCKLFRDHCSEYMGGFVKDLSQLGRPLERVVIVDNSPSAALMQPRNLINIVSWYDDVTDTALLKLLPLLEKLSKAQSCYDVLARESSQGWTA